MSQRRDARLRAVTTLLHGVRSRRARSGGTPALVEDVLTALSAESEVARRRFTILRRSDVAREPHDAIARDVGLSRSQFYRDLREARETLAQALEERFGSIGPHHAGATVDPRFVAIEALRSSGQYERARAMSTLLARNADAADAIRALCARAEMETESGEFTGALETVREARALCSHIADVRLRDLLDASCDVAAFEAAHCLGVPAGEGQRSAAVHRLRARYRGGAADYAVVLLKALIAETSLRFGQGDVTGARAAIEEAAAVAAGAGLRGTRLAAEVDVRASGLLSLQPDCVAAALQLGAGIADAGGRAGDAYVLRVGMQTMSAHLLTLGRFDEAKHYAMEAWALIDVFGSALDRVVVLSNLARIDLHRRDGAAALQWIDMAQAVPCAPFPIAQALAISRAEALVLLDQPALGVALARRTSAKVARWPRLLGRSKLAEAMALSALQRAPEAGRCSADAVELSRDGGGPLLELRALDLNVRLTGNTKSLHALRQLQHALEQDEPPALSKRVP